MQYREFGKTGEKISVLGFGCMRLPEYEKDGKWYIDDEKAIPMLQKAVELGINYFDTGCSYCHGNSEITVGKALHHVRDKVLFSTKCPMGDDIKGTGDYRRMLEQSLRQMDTDHIDFYHFWATNKEVFDNKILKFNLLDEARKAKEEGLIRHISFSFHDKPEYIKYMIDTAEILETMLVQYNFLDRSCEEMIAYAVQQGLGVVAMGAADGWPRRSCTGKSRGIKAARPMSLPCGSCLETQISAAPFPACRTLKCWSKMCRLPAAARRCPIRNGIKLPNRSSR